jgi:hypothetical protein
VWAQLVAFAVGVWLTAAPGFLGYGGAARSNDHVFGPLAATVGLIAAFQVTRGVRWLNLAFGVWLLVAPWVLGHGQQETVNSTLVGLALAGLAWVRGAADESFGGGWRALWDSRAAANTGATA